MFTYIKKEIHVERKKMNCFLVTHTWCRPDEVGRTDRILKIKYDSSFTHRILEYLQAHIHLAIGRSITYSIMHLRFFKRTYTKDKFIFKAGNTHRFSII